MEPNFETLLNKTLPLIKQRATRLSAGNNDVRDHLYSVSLEKIWYYRSGFKGNEIDFQKWISMIVRNASIDIHRSKKAKDIDIDQVSYILADSSNIEKKISDTEFINEIDRSVKEKFNELYYTIFKLHFIEGFDHKQLHIKLSMPKVTVRVAIHYIRKFIKSKYVRTNA